MSLTLAGTRYLLTVDDLLSGWDEKSWLEAADDRKMPDTTVSSFVELEDAATGAGAGSDEEKAMNDIIAVLSTEAVKAEQWSESFCVGIYVLRLNPVDGTFMDLVLDRMVHRMKIRHGMYKNNEDKNAEEKALTTRGNYIRTEVTKLTSARPGQGLGGNESIAAFGSDDRHSSTSGAFDYPNISDSLGGWIPRK
jgi:hypothetical protein